MTERNSVFKFKNFQVVQQSSAMKVGTDGVLLGAWVDVSDCDSVIDVGAGTGLISLMLAQRCAAKITAIEIDKLSADEAAFNAASSQWSSRITVINADFTEWDRGQADLIVSNPPFYVEDIVASDSRRALARHESGLGLDSLIRISQDGLSSKGSLALIAPASRENEIIYLASIYGFYVGRLTRVAPNPSKPSNRILVQLYKKNITTEISQILIRDCNNEYSSEYRELTSDFYLNF